MQPPGGEILIVPRCDIGLRDADVGRGREELPREKVDGLRPLMGGREFSDMSRLLNLSGRGRQHASERGTMLEGLNGVDEGNLHRAGAADTPSQV